MQCGRVVSGSESDPNRPLLPTCLAITKHGPPTNEHFFRPQPPHFKLGGKDEKNTDQKLKRQNLRSHSEEPSKLHESRNFV